MKKQGLGRSLNALLEGTMESHPVEPVVENTETIIKAPIKTVHEPLENEENTKGVLRYLSIELLQRGQYQPRNDFDQEALKELATSIRSQGIVQPLLARKLPSGHYEIIAGERRHRAAQMAGLTEVPVIIKKISGEEALAIGLIENIQRQDLNPLEEAIALQRLSEEFKMTQQDIAETVGRSRVAVSNLIRLLSLHEDVKKLLEHGDLEMGHGRAMLGLPFDQQPIAARYVAGKGLSVRETESYVRYLLKEGFDVNKALEHPARVDPDVLRLQNELAEKLGARVTIMHSLKGKGKLVIQYNSLDELEGVLAHIH